MITLQMFWWMLLAGVLGAALVNVAIVAWRQVERVSKEAEDKAVDKAYSDTYANVENVEQGQALRGLGYLGNEAIEKAQYEKDRYETAVPTVGTAMQEGFPGGICAVPTAGISPIGTAPKGPCKTCGGRMVFGDLSFCDACTKHIRPLPFSLDLQGKTLTKADIVDFARIVGWHRIACWTSHRDALLGIPDNESNWAAAEEATAWQRDKQRKARGQKDILFGRPIRTTDYAPTDRLLSYDLAGDWTGQIVNIGAYPTTLEQAEKASRDDDRAPAV